MALNSMQTTLKAFLILLFDWTRLFLRNAQWDLWGLNELFFARYSCPLRLNNCEKLSKIFFMYTIIKLYRLLRVRYIIIIFILRTTFGVGLRKRQNVLDEEVAKILYQEVDNYIFDVINILPLKLLTMQGLLQFLPYQQLYNKSRRLPTADTDDRGLG